MEITDLSALQGKRQKMYDKTDKMCTRKHAMPWLGGAIRLHHDV